ncbi:MAG: undecaprenyldiphospho-muramoylpentapeptide beta-N-acetylglucosaminyltransferase [Proteobacteria bacterium]|nr:undecaprenyldiphospho-muramoylpentapeptide beta-N-acetylglucosaminyltransferase [Pseudomonadota bacterium]
MSGPVMIMAGGTGGHVYPALAVARALAAMGRDVVWLGTRRGLEGRVIPEQQIPIEWISVSGLRGKGVVSWLIAPFRLLRALFQSLSILRKTRPAVVLGMGGFVSGPGGLAARLLGRRLVIHEQNAVAGLTNRSLARIANRVLEAFPSSFPNPERISSGVETVGNPVRDEILSLPEPGQRMAGRSGRLRLLVLGGSQGALRLNTMMPLALAQIDSDKRPQVWHQAGASTLEKARSGYRRHDLDARVEPFIEDMADAYGWADLVVCRAGALTIFELAAAGLAAVLVPFPSAVDDHQTLNAKWLVRSGAAVLLPEETLAADSLAALILRFAGDRQSLLEMAGRARALAAPGACGKVVQACLTTTDDGPDSFTGRQKGVS